MLSRLRDELLEGEPRTAASAILDAVEARPELPVNLSREDFEGTAADLLVELGENPGVVDHLCQQFARPRLWGVLLDALALLADPAAAHTVAALAKSQLRHPTLEVPELIKLVSTLGCVGGPESREALDAFRARGDWSPDVARELEIAHEALGKPR
ncbi:hypothetical protein D7X96_19545 [Corallococcus interemptor]|uniref:HEAT repeat domain-containing protein n=1 Tax=Corallococcus interemptor TaxID=2316720 RepID=A0A3A8QKH2_9BACT|nr:hypothetical protein D7X96_19545 [Corallococcus interemptor]